MNSVSESICLSKNMKRSNFLRKKHNKIRTILSYMCFENFNPEDFYEDYERKKKKKFNLNSSCRDMPSALAEACQ